MALTRRDAIKTAAVAGASSVTPPAQAAPRAKAAPKTAALVAPKVREKLLLDFGWRFHLGHACDPEKDFGFGREQNTFAKAGYHLADAAKPDFDDSAWRAVNLPHDWAVELPFVPSANPPTGDDPRSDHGYKPLGRDFPETSIGWYRRVFDLPASDLGRHLTLEFDGAFRDAIVLFNGYFVARNQSGYAPFSVDITDFANVGGKNVLAVRCDATLGEGWFYEGAGLYRHVWLVKQAPLRIPQWGVWVKPVLEKGSASLTIATEIENDGPAKTCRLVSTLTAPDGRAIAALKSGPLSLGAGEKRSVLQHHTLAAPLLWSLETPHLYRVLTEIVADGKTVDDCITSFGIRSAVFDPARGFLLNGEPVKLQGTCNHQDHAGVGSALPDRLQSFRIERLKVMGCNAYRTSHNPPTPELLEACDRLGMLVVDETRRMSADDEALGELERLIKRDRNHPSVIAWSIGNEEPQQGTERGARIATTMKQLCTTLDPTRPITAAVDDPKAWGIGITPVLDVLGCNYRTDQIPAYHARDPKKPTMGTETGSTVATRGVYVKDPASGYCVAYDTEFPWWASTAEAWMQVVMPREFIAGGFVWTGFDYRGEPTPFNKWPNVSSQFGILDTCGFPKDNFFYYKAWWGKEPVLHLLPHWNWQAGQSVKVWCHSNLDAVELFLNSQSLGTRKVQAYSHVEWDLTYAPGTLEARGFKNGKQVLTDKRETVGAPAQIVLTPDRAAIEADGEDAVVVTVAIADAQGRIVPTADNQVAFAVSGSGALIGVGNGDPRSHESDKAASRAAFNGLCCAILQASKSAGAITLSASAPGLATASLTVPARPAKPRPCVA